MPQPTSSLLVQDTGSSVVSTMDLTSSPDAMAISALQALVNLSDVEDEGKCQGGCPEIFEQFIGHPNWFCDGGPNLFPGGNWIGHVFPGTLFLIWGSHWLLGFVRHYFECLQKREAYVSKSCYRLFWLPERWPLEASVKFGLPFLNILLELWLAHPGGYRRLVCAADTPRVGHFIGNHLNNWTHAYMYPGFIISGLVDLVSLRIELPHGVQQAFLALSFLFEALLMGLHKKHTPMDLLVHSLLTGSMLFCAACTAAEAAWRGVPLLTAGRIAGMYLQGAWFIAAARMLYEEHPAWDTINDTDMAPVASASILFVTLVMMIVAIILAAFLMGFAGYRRKQSHANVSSDVRGTST